MRTRRIWLGLLVVLALVAAACGGSSGGGGGGGGEESSGPDTREARVGGSATVIVPESRSLDPALVINSSTQGADLINAIYDTLYTVDPETDAIQPRIATDFTSTDGITWTLTLKSGVTFSDGTPFDAEAVKFNWQRSIDNPRASANAQAKQIVGMTATSPTTLEVTLNNVNKQFFQAIPALPFTWIASPASIQAAGADFGNSANVVGAGPFKVTSRVPNSETVLVRNESYWQPGLPKLDQITYRPVADQQQATDTVTTGGAQAYLWTPEQLARQAEDQGFRSSTWATLQGGTSILFNQNKPPFDNVKARKAVTLALDIPQMIDVVFEGTKDKITTMFRESSPFYDAAYTFPDADATEAQKLFDELAQETGGPLTFDMAVSTNTVNTQLMKQLQSQLENFQNVSASVKVIDGANYGITLYTGDFNSALYAIASPDPVPQFDGFLSTYSVPIASLKSPKADKAIADGKATTDTAQRKAAYDQLQQVLVDEYPEIWMYRNDLTAIYQSDTTGLQAYGQGSWLVDSYGFVE